jgi:hypothetical protein
MGAVGFANASNVGHHTTVFGRVEFYQALRSLTVSDGLAGSVAASPYS